MGDEKNGERPGPAGKDTNSWVSIPSPLKRASLETVKDTGVKGGNGLQILVECEEFKWIMSCMY